MDTKPATEPFIIPKTVACLFTISSISIHENAAVDVAICVISKDIVADSSAANDEPPLNPNQPTQRKHAPVIVCSILLGVNFFSP